jgi:uncharacterized protein (TIGR03118 family)
MTAFRMFRTFSRSMALVVTALLATFASAQHYNQTDLTTDVSAVSPNAALTDANLVNSWGLTRGSATFWWISDNATGRATLYDGDGTPQSLVVTIPAPGGNGTSAPTGAVFNFTNAFPVKGTKAQFLFVTEDGTIAGWNAAAGNSAVIVLNRAGKAVYKGCAIAQTPQGPRLFATNYTTGTLEEFDGNFNPVALSPLAFRISGLPEGFVPFNVQNVGGNLVVTFAFRQAGSTDEQHAPGLGAVAIFDTFGRRLRVLQTGAFLNAPWGVALAPSDFGAFSHRLLIGNFGDGTIHAFNLFTGAMEGALLTPTNQPIRIDGLWALGFGNGNRAGSATAMFFTAGPNDEKDGLFGRLAPVATEQRGSTE